MFRHLKALGSLNYSNSEGIVESQESGTGHWVYPTGDMSYKITVIHCATEITNRGHCNHSTLGIVYRSATFLKHEVNSMCLLVLYISPNSISYCKGGNAHATITQI